MNNIAKAIILAAACMGATGMQAQLSTNPDKFLGNITTGGQVCPPGIEYADLWNQITPENESKWSSIEGTRNKFKWTGCDACYNYAKEHNFPFKFHCLVWGAQYPSWMDGLTTNTQYNEIVEWMDSVKDHYPQLDMIDVVNEALPGHQPAPYKAALGGDGVTGYDWIVKAFEMAHERWPEAILIYNDYNTFQWNRTDFINLVKTIRDAGAPIDAYGCQSHDLTDCSFSTFKSAMTSLQTSLQMPMYSTEYDIDTSDDEKQKKQYMDQITYMWEQPYVAGVTLWGYIYGNTWVPSSGIIRNGADRPAMTWLKEYMASDAAKTAPSPFPGMKKEASIYIKPAQYHATIDEPLLITVDATLRTKEIASIELYVKNQLYATLTEAPYEIEYTPEAKGSYDLKAIVTATDGTQWTRLGGFKAFGARVPWYGEATVLPGTVEAEDFDKGGDGFTYHDSDSKNEGTSAYRTDGEGVDIVTCNGGYAIGYTAKGEWLEYSVDVTQSGRYVYEIIASSAVDDSSVMLSMLSDDGQLDFTNEIAIPNTGSWDTYTSIRGGTRNLSIGEQRLRLTITGPQCNIDRITIVKKFDGIVDAVELQSGEYDVYTTSGIYVGRMSYDSAETIGMSLRQFTGNDGIYVVKDAASGEACLIKAN